MANIRSCNKHNMIACVEKTAQNADFYQIIDFLTGCSINYSLLVDPDLIGPWLQQFWATASLQVINDVPHIRAKDIFKWYSLFLWYPRFVSTVFGNKAVRGGDRPQDLYTVSLPSKVFTFMRKHRAQVDARECSGTPIPSASIRQCCSFSKSAHSQRLHQYKMRLQTSEEMRDFYDIYALHSSRKLSKFVQPVVKHHALWVENQNLKKQKRRRKRNKKKVSSVKLGRNKDEGTLSEEHKVQEEDTTHHFFDDTADRSEEQMISAVTPDLERKVMGQKKFKIEEERTSN
ncbi:hypothetical protein Tco_0312723 [Tanacetum coccineum]